MFSEIWSDLGYRVHAVVRRSAVEQELDLASALPAARAARVDPTIAFKVG